MSEWLDSDPLPTDVRIAEETRAAADLLREISERLGSMETSLAEQHHQLRETALGQRNALQKVERVLSDIRFALYAVVALLAFAIYSMPAGATDRSRALRAEFQRLNHCPSTGKPRGPCPGWQVDHAVPLCLAGPRGDTISNLRWISVDAHRAKTRRDVRLCLAASGGA